MWLDKQDKKNPLSISSTGGTLYVTLTFDLLEDEQKASLQPPCCPIIEVILLKKDCFSLFKVWSVTAAHKMQYEV